MGPDVGWQGSQSGDQGVDLASLARNRWPPHSNAFVVSHYPQGDFERPTVGLGNRCSIRLSYGGEADFDAMQEVYRAAAET